MMCVLLSALLIAQTQAYNEKRDPEDHFNTAGRAGRGAFRGFTVVRPMTVGVIDEIDARDYCDDDIIPEVGVSKECLVILDNIAWQVIIRFLFYFFIFTFFAQTLFYFFICTFFYDYFILKFNYHSRMLLSRYK